MEEGHVADIDREKLDAVIRKHGYTDYRWIDPKSVVISQWVRMKCEFGCPDYAKNATCPPNTPSVAECRQFFDEYSTAVVFHFEKAVDKPEDRGPWSREVNNELLELEREVFLAGCQKAFLLFMDTCRVCADCAISRDECRNPQAARPAPEAMAMDVFATVRQYGYPIDVLSDYSKAMNRYAFLLID
jgi:predicted metal-binding protein